MRGKATSLFFVLVSFLSGSSAMAVPLTVFNVASGDRTLEHGNSNKIVVGVGNRLHAVQATVGQVWYSTSLNGSSWTAPITVSGETSAILPAVATDGAGNVGVVWVDNTNWPQADGVLYYAYKSPSGAWHMASLGVEGTEPALVASGTSMYLTWSTGTAVLYAKFPSLTPPSSLAYEAVDFVFPGCANTRLRFPAITLASVYCAPPAVMISYLYSSDEQGALLCPSSVTKVGPRVFQRNNTTASWSLVYQDVSSSGLPTSSVDPLSLSMSTRFSTGDTFLAWSDEQNGVARARVAHGVLGGSWSASTISNSRRHVHVRTPTTGAYPATRFRLSMSGDGGLFFNDEFFSLNASWSTATWTGASPTWDPWTVLDGFGGWPQAHFWNQCVSGVGRSSQVYFQFRPSSGPPWLQDVVSTDYANNVGCLITSPPPPLDDCKTPLPAVVQP